MENAKDPILEEIALPELLRVFSAYLSSMCDYFKPNQMMGNFASRVLDRGKFQAPSYTPFIVADMSTSPGLFLPLTALLPWRSGRPPNRIRSRVLSHPPFTHGRYTGCGL